MADEQKSGDESVLERAVKSLVGEGIPEETARAALDEASRGYLSGKEPLADCSPENAALIKEIVDRRVQNLEYKKPDSEQ